MKFNIYIILIYLFIFSFSGYSQKIYSSQYEYQADVKVFVVDYMHQADLKVFIGADVLSISEWNRGLAVAIPSCG